VPRNHRENMDFTNKNTAITVNIDDKQNSQIRRLIGKNKLYPSRSEFIRVACREFIQRHIDEVKIKMYGVSK